ncbi:MAG: polymer-forming cytoskeletal protein [Patescibacteria group bacterium]|jgi:cytoskeletal protein CcmA (bactofilin family)
MGKENAETIIGPSVHVEGNFQGAGDIVVEGSVAGTLKTTSNVRIGESAKVKADIECDTIYVAGEVRGNIIAKGQLEITQSGKVQGNVACTVLSIAPGAKLHGKCAMNGKMDSKEEAEEHADDRKSE